MGDTPPPSDTPPGDPESSGEFEVPTPAGSATERPEPGREGRSDGGAAADSAPGLEGRASRRGLLREVGVVFVASVVLTGGLALVQASVGVLAPYVYLLVAAVFLVLPHLVVTRWRREDPVAAGMHFGPIVRGVAVGVLAALVTAVPFAVGYHVWQTSFLDGRADPSLDAYWRFPAESRGMPASLRSLSEAGDSAGQADGQAPRGVFVWTEGRSVRVWWRDVGALDVSVDAGSGELTDVATGAPRVVQDSSRVAVWGGGPAFLGLDAEVAPGSTPVKVLIRRDKAAVGLDEVRVGVGEGEAEAMPLVLDRSLLWIFDLLLLQFFFVALPEEFFYRGYVQPTLGRALSRGERGSARSVGRVGIGWFSVSHPVWIASVLFALGHVLVDGNWIRAAVFFPSLAFGELRSRTGGIVAPLTYHGLCNIMVELASVHYTGA